MGAFGAALARPGSGAWRQSQILTAEAAGGTSPTPSKPTTCNGCTNHCSLTVNQFDGGRRFISGNRCSKPLGGEQVEMPDLMHYKYKKLRAMEGNGIRATAAGASMGIPFGLNMYENLPFWYRRSSPS